MATTTLGIKFDIEDLDAAYEVVGTSDNYSFQYNLGVGSSLINNDRGSSNNTVRKTIPLKGNYGVFDVRVYAVSNIGIRSEFIQERITISPPNFDGTFTFNNLRIADLPPASRNNIIDVITPQEEGGLLVSQSEFLGRKSKIQWELIPPVGHAQEGSSLSSDLLNDDFFDHFEVKIKKGVNGILVGNSTLNDSEALQAKLSSSEPAQALSFYRNFELDIDTASFGSLDLERINSFEIVAYDSFGRTCTGILTGINFEPTINSFSHSMRGSSTSFSWSSVDNDFSFVKISGIAIPSEKNLFSSDSIHDNFYYYTNLKNASPWRNIPNKVYERNQTVLHSDGLVYQAKVTHTASLSKNPANSSYWNQLEEPFDFKYIEEIAPENNYEQMQVFGYSYYYGFEANDGFGPGKNYNLTTTGLYEEGPLQDFTSLIRIDNLRFRERDSDLIFDWDLVDNDGNSVDLSERKFIFTESDIPSLLGISGSLFDADTELFLSGITVGNEASSAALNDQGGKEKVEGLHNAKVFNNYEYTREINNAIYKAGGFPSDAYDFSSSTVYSPDSGPKNVTTDLGLFEIKSQNSLSIPFIRPSYSEWDSSKNYIYRSSTPHSDVVSYQGSIYKSTQNSGPEYTNGFFNEYSSYSPGDIITSPKSNVSIFKENVRYEQGSVVLYRGEAYIALRSQSIDNAITPSVESDFWRVATEGVDYKDSVFKAKADIASPIPIDPSIDSTNWEEQTPEVSDKFQLQVSFFDKFANYNANDLVYSEDIVYKALQNNPTGQPIFATTNAGGVNDINYINSHWMPIWERDTKYDDIVFKHIGIPQSGKRSVGLEIAILDNNGEIIQKERIVGQNYEPSILANGFNVDPFSEVTKVKFNFNYAFGAQESTTKVHLYRSTQPNFSIYDDRGFAIDKVGKINVGGQEIDSPLVKINLGAGDSTFGQNITTIVDSPPINDEITGYYYKILPFDAFGSGDVYNLENNQGALDLIKVYPKGYSSQDPSIPAGPISENILKNLVPGPVVDFSGDTAFDNYFLNWAAPNYSVGRLDIVPDDVKYYEIWESEDDHLHFGTLNVNLTQASNTGFNRIGQELNSVGPIPPELQDPGNGITNATNILNSPALSQLSQITHKGGINDKRYFWVRPVDQVGNKGPFTGAANLNSDDVKGLELILRQAKTTDLADFEQNLTDAFPNVLALVPNNPFADNYPSANQISWERHIVYYDGTGYVIGEGVADTDEPYVYWSATGKQATHGYDVTPLTSDQSGVLGLTGAGGAPLNNSINNPLRNILYSGNYNTSKYHPAGEGDTTELNGDPYNNNFKPSLLGEEHDFIIARNAAGTATPMWHAFANASIGTAHIREAAITSAKIHTLTADKIRSAEVRSQDIQVGGTGQIRSVGFPGLVNPIANQPKGFAISGDGSFIFAGDDGRLYFDDGVLTLAGKLRTEDNKEYTFPDMTAEPNSFFYVEQSDGTYIPEDDNDVCDIIARFQNSSITSDEVRFRADKVFVGGNVVPIFGYDDRDSNGKYDISGFTYDPSTDFTDGFVKQARGEFSVTGFDHIINSTLPNTCNSILISASGEKTSTERSIPINFIADGAASIYVELDVAQQVYKYNYDREFADTNKTLSLKAIPYNTYGSLHYIFSTGKDLDNLVEIANQRNNDSHTISNLDQKFDDYDDTPFLAHVQISGVHNTQVIASDFVTIYGALPGKDSYTVLLSNENVTFPVDEHGKISSADFARGATDVEMYRGYEKYEYKSGSNDSLSYDVTSVSSNPSKLDFTESFFTDSNGKTQYRLTVNQFDDIDEGKITLTIGDNGYKGTSDAINFEKIYTVNKSRAGAKGRVVEIIPESFIVQYDTEGQIRSNQNININFNYRNFETSTPRFTFISGSTEIQNYNTNPNKSSFIFEPPTVYADGRSTSFEVRAYDQRSTDNAWFEAARDIMTIHGVKDSSNALTFVQTNPHANIPLNFGANDELIMPSQIDNYLINIIAVFEGETQLTFKDATSDSHLSNGEFRVNVIEGHNGFKYKKKEVYNNSSSPLHNKAASFTDFDVANWTSSSWLNTIQTFSITARDLDGKIRKSTQVQTISTKSDGRNARSVELSSTQTVFRYKTNGSLSTGNGANAIISVDILNAIPNVNYYLTYKSDKSDVFFVGNGSTWESLSVTSTGKTYTANHSSSNRKVEFRAPSTYEPGGNYNIPATLTVELREVSDTSTDPLAIDMITMNPLKDGADTITPLLTNQHVAVSIDINGNLFTTPVLFTNTFAFLYHGSSPLTFRNVSSTNNLNDGEYYITRTISKSDNINNDFTDDGIDQNFPILKNLTSWRSGVTSAEREITFHYKTSEGLVGSVKSSQTFSTSKQGQKGNKGVGVVYRGKWASGQSYVGAEETSARGDVVYYSYNNSNYWIAIEDHTSSSSFITDFNNGKWVDFEAEFKSVATDLLLANDVAITHSLSLGTSDPENPNVGSGGVIKSPPAKTFGDSTQGFILSNTKISNQDVTQFEVGNIDSHIKFDSSSERIELKGSLILNNIGDSTIGFNSLDGTNATFIGGGYNNSITGYGGYHGLASAIVGGAYNDITGRFSTIGGGFDNNVGDNFSFIGGGYKNEMSEFTSGNAGANIIGAGSNNEIHGGSHQGLLAGLNNVIEYDPTVKDFGSIINNEYSSQDRKVVLDPTRFPLNSNLFGRNGTDASIFQTSSNSLYDYQLYNSKFGAYVYIPETILRGYEVLRGTWIKAEYAFYNDVDATFYVIPDYNRNGESNYWAYGVAVNTIYDGWFYISNSYNSQGHWIWIESLNEWVFIWNKGTYPEFAGLYYSFKDNVNKSI